MGDFKDPEIFKVVVPYFQLNHGPLSVLIHPRTDQGDLKDHTEHAYGWVTKSVWIPACFEQEKQKLNVSSIRLIFVIF